MKQNAPRARFGPAGRAESFKTMGYKSSEQVPAYLANFGLDAFEYQGGHGVRLNPATGAALAAAAARADITLSIHAPYYISTAGSPEAREKSLDYFLQSAKAVKLLGGSRVVFHPGGAGKNGREAAMALTFDTLARARALLDENGLEDICLCPETMGRVNQLGTLEEVLALCRRDARHIPCLDFGHLNARGQGCLATKADFRAVMEAVGDALQDERAGRFHVHFSKIEYTAAGEKRHLTFEDSRFGPPFEPFAEAVAELGLGPVVICESAGTQTEDAARLMKVYNKCYKKQNR